jgi:hypothetical protein
MRLIYLLSISMAIRIKEKRIYLPICVLYYNLRGVVDPADPYSFLHMHSMSKTQDIAFSGLLSPLQTQSPLLLFPVEEVRNWLASRGSDAEEVDILRRNHDQRLQNIENEHHFLTHLQAIVKTRLRQPHHLPEYSFPTENELDQIKASLASLASDANTQLREQSNAAGKKMCIDALILLPADKRVAFLSFINNDTANNRLRFISVVLPIFVESLSAKLTKDSEAKDEKQTLVTRRPSPPHPVPGRLRKQKRRTTGKGESCRVTKIPRRSERIKRRADDRQDRWLVTGRSASDLPKEEPVDRMSSE